MREDYYELLELPHDAPAPDVKAAFRRLALRFHPDRNEGNAAAEERFKLVAEAYRTLGDPERRADYDVWLARTAATRNLPGELASMPRHVHVSSRRSRERRSAREARRAPRRRAATHIVFRRSRLHRYVIIGLYAMVLFSLLPTFFKSCSISPSAPVKKAGEAPKNEAGPAVWANVLRMENDLRERAAKGDARAQYELGFFLHNKSRLGQDEAMSGLIRRAAAAGYLREAHEWLRKSAQQGNRPAQNLLRSLTGAGE